MSEQEALTRLLDWATFVNTARPADATRDRVRADIATLREANLVPRAELDNLRETRQREISATEQWRERAEKAEAQVAELEAAVQLAITHIRGEATKFSEREPIAVLYQLAQALANMQGDKQEHVNPDSYRHPLPSTFPGQHGSAPSDAEEALAEALEEIDTEYQAAMEEPCLCGNPHTEPSCPSCGKAENARRMLFKLRRHLTAPKQDEPDKGDD